MRPSVSADARRRIAMFENELAKLCNRTKLDLAHDETGISITDRERVSVPGWPVDARFLGVNAFFGVYRRNGQPGVDIEDFEGWDQ